LWEQAQKAVEDIVGGADSAAALRKQITSIQ
jgi:hypothetical protein